MLFILLRMDNESKFRKKCLLNLSYYLLPVCIYIFLIQMSLTLTQAFGKDTEAGLWTLDYVIGKFESNLSLWQSESKVIIDSAQTLSVVLNNTER